MKDTHKTTEAQRRAIYNYDDKFSRLSIRLPAGTKERIEKQGYKSINAFCTQAILDRLDQLETRRK